MLSFTLEKRLRDFTLGLSLEVGIETLVLIGYSGCGKSTMLRLLAGLLDADSGRVELDGRVLLDTETGRNLPPEGRNVGFLVQSYALFPHLSVTSNVAYGISHLDRDEQARQVEEALDFVGIRYLAGAMPRNLSGGEQQRVALARALARRPSFLLLDEPLSALDVTTRTRVRSELREILENLAIPSIVVTHDYEDARILGNKIAVMERGRILQAGTAAEISRYPANTFVAAFTETNLAPVSNGDKRQVAFDPWRMSVAREPTGNEHEWRGRVRDIASMGAFTRLVLDVNQAPSLFADIPGSCDIENCDFDVGDTVFARVSPDDVRPVESFLRATRADTYGGRGQKRRGCAPARGPQEKPSVGHEGLSVGCSVERLGHRADSSVVARDRRCRLRRNNRRYGWWGRDAHRFRRGQLHRRQRRARRGVRRAARRGAGRIELRRNAGAVHPDPAQGASGDFFLSADLDYARRAQDEGLINSFTEVSRNEEVIIVPSGNPAGVESLEDLGTQPVELVIGVDTVPIGKYTRQIFENANGGYGSDFSERVLDRVVSEETNTREVAQKIALGEGEAAIVYRTDVTPSIADQVEVVEIPQEYNVDAFNYAGVLSNAPNPELAQEYLDFMILPEGQEILRGFGYEPI